jgi:hypothetical protein
MTKNNSLKIGQTADFFDKWKQYKTPQRATTHVKSTSQMEQGQDGLFLCHAD